MSEFALEVKNLSVSLAGHHILEDITFSVHVGSATAIIGPNGAGKSVLVKAILRLIPKSHGKVTIFGTPHEKYRRVARQISYVPQRINIHRDFPLTVKGLFALKSRRGFGTATADRQRAHALLETTGIVSHENRRLSELSGGQLQRVMLAYSLMDKPRLLILDEPSAGIDVAGQETIYALLKRIQQEQQLTLVLISHELDIVMAYADQVLCLNRKLLCAGVPNEVLSQEMINEMYGAPTRHFHHEPHER